VTADDIELEQLFPCADDAFLPTIVAHAIPFLWTNLQNAISHASFIYMTNHSDVMNHDWPMTIPVFNLSRTAFRVPPPVEAAWTFHICRSHI
jgi:hypothetical protein